MNKCDLCQEMLVNGSVRISPLQIQQAAQAGLYPPETTLEKVGSAFGISPEETYNRWFQRAVNATNDWTLCLRCAERVEPLLANAPPPQAFPQYASGGPQSHSQNDAEFYSAQTTPPLGAPPVQPSAPPKERIEPLRFNPDFPSPTQHKRSLATRTNINSALIGIGAGIGVSLLIALAAPKESMLGHMFDLRSVATLIPVAISCMFFWAMVICIYRKVRLGDLERTSSKRLLLHATRILSIAGPDELARDLELKEGEASPLLRRLQAVVRQWCVRPSLQDADLVLQQHVANDEDSVRSGYSLVRTFIWALPVLGLIGTVIGISVAVGGFAQFLGGDIDDVGIIKKNLVGVTGGLSFAFLITLQGLLTALIVMLTASSLQGREEKLNAEVQQNISDIFLPKLQEVAPEIPGAAVAAGTGMPEFETWREALLHVANGVMNTVREGGARIIEEITERTETHQHYASDWVRSLHAETEKSAQKLGAVLDKVGLEMNTSSQEFLMQLSQVRGLMDEQISKMEELMQAQTHVAEQQRQSNAQVVAQQTASVQAISDKLSQLTETTSKALSYQTELRSAVQQLGDSKLEPALTRLATELAAQNQETRATAQALNSVVAATRDVLDSQANLQAAVRQLHETGFEQTLATFRDSLVALRPTLQSFRQPFVLQAIPVPTTNVEGGD